MKLLLAVCFVCISLAGGEGGAGVKEKRRINHRPRPHVDSITITKTVHVPYPVKVEKKVPVPVKVPVEEPYPVYITKHYPVKVEKKVPVAVKIPVPQPYPVEKKVHVPINVPVEKPVPYPVEKPYPVFVEKEVPYPVEKEVPVPIHVPVERPIPVSVEKQLQFMQPADLGAKELRVVPEHIPVNPVEDFTSYVDDFINQDVQRPRSRGEWGFELGQSPRGQSQGAEGQIRGISGQGQSDPNQGRPQVFPNQGQDQSSPTQSQQAQVFPNQGQQAQAPPNQAGQPPLVFPSQRQQPSQGRIQSNPNEDLTATFDGLSQPFQGLTDQPLASAQSINDQNQGLNNNVFDFSIGNQDKDSFNSGVFGGVGELRQLQSGANIQFGGVSTSHIKTRSFAAGKTTGFSSLVQHI